MAVRVRMFASLREAAGTGEETVDAGPLPEMLELLCRRHGATFRARLAVSSVLLDGNPVVATAPVPVRDGSELVLLPPVSGGAA
jgi:molybdopterin synthase catalytic subunit/molybdopterin synthase sulfur carrier subunit